MITRRKDLLKNVLKKELLVKDLRNKQGIKSISILVDEREKLKAGLLKKFSVKNLEEMLNSGAKGDKKRPTGKNVAREVIATLVPEGKEGIITLLEKGEDNAVQEYTNSDIQQAKEMSSEIQKVITHNKPTSTLSSQPPYKFTSLCKLPRSNSSKPTTKTLNKLP
uniref:Uncharacterized protein n=1 Tax=Euplotes crassus TaxID=5936 RepID=A0A7S3KK50_EUPCR|mmetsp:Transcript_31429/g.30935  ORF Transcript_31429/g.30935 Transcript_31429/m.30935 type:complete len:165 (+) Transcript_31429:110-604(+)